MIKRHYSAGKTFLREETTATEAHGTVFLFIAYETKFGRAAPPTAENRHGAACDHMTPRVT